MAYKRKPRNNDINEDWMGTFADMVSLLLCFFIIILNVAKPTATSFEELRKGFMGEFTQEEVSTPFSDIYDAFTSVIDNNQMQQDISIEESDKGIMLEFSDASLFKPGSAELLPRAKPLLDDIALALTRFEYDRYLIEVEGHTDNVPISTAQYPSNWELSTARASAVVKYFIEKSVEPKRLKASGFADTQPKMPNEDSYGNPMPENQAENRRISVRLERQ